MRTRVLAVLVLATTVVALTLVATAGASGGVTRFVTHLTGAAEVPGPGDPDGVGFAKIAINERTGEVCWRIRVKGITLPSIGAHIHVGAADVAGPIVVHLTPPDQFGKSVGCTDAGVDLAKAIVADPAGYYVNVHTDDFQPGALRGQLG